MFHVTILRVWERRVVLLSEVVSSGGPEGSMLVWSSEVGCLQGMVDFTNFVSISRCGHFRITTILNSGRVDARLDRVLLQRVR